MPYEDEIVLAVAKCRECYVLDETVTRAVARWFRYRTGYGGEFVESLRRRIIGDAVDTDAMDVDDAVPTAGKLEYSSSDGRDLNNASADDEDMDGAESVDGDSLDSGDPDYVDATEDEDDDADMDL